MILLQSGIRRRREEGADLFWERGGTLETYNRVRGRGRVPGEIGFAFDLSLLGRGDPHGSFFGGGGRGGGGGNVVEEK